MNEDEIVKIMEDGFKAGRTNKQIANEILNQVLAAYGIN